MPPYDPKDGADGFATRIGLWPNLACSSSCALYRILAFFEKHLCSINKCVTTSWKDAATNLKL